MAERVAIVEAGAERLDALRPLAEDWALRAALFEVIAHAKHAPYVHRAATELALAWSAAVSYLMGGRPPRAWMT